ncbi:MAG: SH3 domain-containing protein [Pelolinea sp.]|nr:SH3 domain-containing protein [Pelolinea sp.]
MIRKTTINFSIAFISLIILLAWLEPVSAGDTIAQQPTVAIPTVTGTPEGVTATVLLDQPDPVNVRSGPGSFFDKVGVLSPGQKVSVSGRSAGGDWVMIDYPGVPGNFGWVYSPLVYISPGELPIIEPPSTPTPEVTQTINPTLAAQFVTTPNPTRLSTFTPGDPLVIPTYEDTFSSSFLGGIPMGLIIILLAGLGGLLALFSFIRSR